MNVLKYSELSEVLNTIIEENDVIKLGGLLKVLSENPDRIVIVSSSEKTKRPDHNLANFKPKNLGC